MKSVLQAAIVAAIAGATALLGQSGARAQALDKGQTAPPAEGARYSAPAMSLEEIPAKPGLPNLTVVRPGGVSHVFPTVRNAAARAAASTDPGPLLYHSGGPVLQPTVRFYLIVWAPSTLQNGKSSGFSTNYVPVQMGLMSNYGGHGISANNTQYYQTISSTTTYITGFAGMAGATLDTAAYPASGCTDTATPGACITDAQIQTEIQRVMGVNGWTGGPDKIFVLLTSMGEGSCFDSTNKSCAYTQYCAYHSFVSGASPSIVYANIPYGNTTSCQASGTPSPSGDAQADAAATALSHEISESITDPLLNAWYTALGNEIGDLCAYIYATNTWDAAQANQMWGGLFLELQEEFDNHTSSCVQLGP
jgi:hypothetical protein